MLVSGAGVGVGRTPPPFHDEPASPAPCDRRIHRYAILRRRSSDVEAAVGLLALHHVGPRCRGRDNDKHGEPQPASPRVSELYRHALPLPREPPPKKLPPVNPA